MLSDRVVTEVVASDYYDDDDLGYYEDGVKRTLTDEQIRIFRHSEIHALLRERERLREEQEEAVNEAEQNAQSMKSPQESSKFSVLSADNDSSAFDLKNDESKTQLPGNAESAVNKARQTHSKNNSDFSKTREQKTKSEIPSNLNYGRKIVSYAEEPV